MQTKSTELLVAGAGCAAIGLVAGDWLPSLSALTLWAGIRLVSTSDGMFVLPAAFAFHWMETSVGLFYNALTGRQTTAFYDSDYRTMVLIALGCCLAMALGIWIGRRWSGRRHPHGYDSEDAAMRPEYAVSFSFLVCAYLATVSFEGTLNAVAVSYPTIRQILVTADTARLGILFLLLRRLIQPSPRWMWVGAILVVEIALGLTGFFAGFREPLVLAALAILEIFDRRNLRHWMAVTAAGVCAIALGMLWMSVRGEYRKNYLAIDNFQASRSTRLQSIESLTSEWMHGDQETMWASADKLVDRMWTVYYPALAVARVPAVIPHTDGAILAAALTHIVTPRVFFPDKPGLQSDSEKVRMYSGVLVAGPEQNTTIAFGYAAEGYVDFGVPLMFLPLCVFGAAIGWLYELWGRVLRHRDLNVAFTTVAFWLSLYLFERSWAMMLGVSLGLMVYLGLPVLLIDRLLLARHRRRLHEAAPPLYAVDEWSGTV